ncbi:hypothetical protein Droror1_Dr00013753 [Drosera rotundifolia]
MDRFKTMIDANHDCGESMLMDRFERLSFEIQLKQAMLKRSLSESIAERTNNLAPVQASQGILIGQEVKQQRQHGGGWSSSMFKKVMKKLLKPILIGRKNDALGKGKPQQKNKDEYLQDGQPQHFAPWRSRFSKSVRL